MKTNIGWRNMCGRTFFLLCRASRKEKNKNKKKEEKKTGGKNSDDIIQRLN